MNATSPFVLRLTHPSFLREQVDVERSGDGAAWQIASAAFLSRKEHRPFNQGTAYANGGCSPKAKWLRRARVSLCVLCNARTLVRRLFLLAAEHGNPVRATRFKYRLLMHFTSPIIHSFSEESSATYDRVLSRHLADSSFVRNGFISIISKVNLQFTYTRLSRRWLSSK